ncbi:hypothetical protein SynRS9915_00216 [Synechococcus sp. RS9915]|nr:hypothetical protein SynRS9915_00216 [Synechococcus sp. RS9915]
MSTKHDFEYATKWETIRSAYFRANGQPSRADQCTKTLSELQWRLALLPISAEKEAPNADGFVESDWSSATETMTNAGLHQEVKEPAVV